MKVENNNNTNISFCKNGRTTVDYEYINPLGEDATKYAENLAKKLKSNNVDFFVMRNFKPLVEPDNIRFLPTNELIVIAKRFRTGLGELLKGIPTVKSEPLEINTEIGDNFIKELEQRALSEKSENLPRVFWNFIKRIQAMNL